MNQEFSEPDMPPTATIPDRPRLKDFLATMKPDTWGSSTTGRPSKRLSQRREEIMYTPPPPPPSSASVMSNIPDNNSFYANTSSAPAPMYSTIPSTTGPGLTSLPNFSPRHYQEQSSTFLRQSNGHQLHPTDHGTTLLAQNPMMHNAHPIQPMYQPNPSAQQTLYQPPPPQHIIRQPSPTPQLTYQTPPPQQPIYQPPVQQPSYQSQLPPQAVYQPSQPSQQPVYQPPPPQQPVYQPPPPPQQSVYQPPPPPQQPVYQQPTYQPSAQLQQPVQQPVYQPSPQQQIYQQPIYQVSPIPQAVHPSFAQQIPQANTHQIPTDPNRSVQQSLPSQPKFDPYRPQPVGMYDIPKPINQPTITNPQTRINPQDVYRPGGLLTTNQTPMPSLSTNNNNYNPNQFVQYTPSLPPSVPPPTPQQQQQQQQIPLVPTSTPIITPVKPIPQQQQQQPVVPTVTPVNVPAQSSISTIADDLLSLALEQQANSSTNETESIHLEPQSPSPVEEELHPKNITKPIACIQPLPIVNEDKPVVQQSVATPVASLSSSQDPYDDKEKLDQLASDVQRFEKHVSTMTKKILNGTVPLEVEWKVRIDSFL